MPARKPLTETARRKAIRQVMDQLNPLLGRLSSCSCPYCGSRTLVAILKAHSGIFVRCDGLTLRPDEPGVQPTALGSNNEGVCLYQACIPLTIEDEPPPNLIAIEIENGTGA